MDNNAQAGFFLTLKEASELSGLSLSTLRRAVKAGELITAERENIQHPVKVSRDGVLELVKSKSKAERDQVTEQLSRVKNRGIFGRDYKDSDLSNIPVTSVAELFPSPPEVDLFSDEPQELRVNTSKLEREVREMLEAELAKSRDELKAVRGELDQLKDKAKKDELDLISLGDALSLSEDEVAELLAEREALLKRAERAEGVAEGYRLGVDRTLEAFTDDLAKRLAEGVQVAQPVNNREQVVTYSNSEPVNNREQVRRRTLRERLFGR